MAGFIALQMSRMWGIFEAGEKRTIDAALRGAPACPYHNDLARYPNITDLDRDGIVYHHLECSIKDFQLLVSDRKHPVGDIVYRCFSLAFNCKYISFARTGPNLGRHGYVVNVSAIIAATDPGKCDGHLLDWCIRKGHCLRTSATRSMPEHETPNTTWTKNSVDVSLGWPLWIDLCDAELDHRCVLRPGAGQTPSIASNTLISLRWNELRHDVIRLSKDHVYVCIYIFRRLWHSGYSWMGTITSWMISFPYIIRGIWDGYFCIHIARHFLCR